MPFSLFGNGKQKSAEILEEGWQLYAKPTTLEPVGTIFRIDDGGRRFMVDRLDVGCEEGKEAVAKVRQQLQAELGFFARFLGLDRYSGSAKARSVEALVFEVVDPVRQAVTDASLDHALAGFLPTLKYRADNHYYIIRETRSASALTYQLTQTQLGELGGEASLHVVVSAGATMGMGKSGFYEINQTFPERMRVMFLAEEIRPIKAGMASSEPSLGRVPVREPLTWNEG